MGHWSERPTVLSFDVTADELAVDAPRLAVLYAAFCDRNLMSKVTGAEAGTPVIL